MDRLVEPGPRCSGAGGQDGAAAGPARLPAAFVALAAAGTVLAIGYVAWDNAPFVRGELGRGQIVGRDFAVFWYAGVLAWQGSLDIVFDGDAFNRALGALIGDGAAYHSFPYPPHGLWTLLPLALFPYGLALAVWSLGGLALFVWAVLGGRRWRPRDVLLLALAPACLVNLTSGQNGLMSAALMLGGWRLLDRRPGLAGILFGLLCYKPQLGVLLPVLLIADRRWTCLAAAAATAGLLVAVSLAAPGPDAWQSYLGGGAAAQKRFLEEGSGMFTSMVPTVFMAARMMQVPTDPAYMLQILVAAVVVTACFVVVRRHRPPPEQQALLAVTGLFLTSPYSFNYDMPMMAGATLWLLRTRPVPAGEGAVLGLAWALPVAMMPIAWLILVLLAKVQPLLALPLLPASALDLLSAPLLLSAAMQPTGALHLPLPPLVIGLAFAVALRHAAAGARRPAGAAGPAA